MLFSKMKHKAQHSSKRLKKICIERIVNSAIPKNTQIATQFGMSVFNGEYTDFFYAMFENSEQETVSSRFCSMLTDNDLFTN